MRGDCFEASRQGSVMSTRCLHRMTYFVVNIPGHTAPQPGRRRAKNRCRGRAQKMVFATSPGDLKELSIHELQRREFSPAHRQLRRVKNRPPRRQTASSLLLFVKITFAITSAAAMATEGERRQLVLGKPHDEP